MAMISVVAVAQLVESRIVIPVVVGSSPISHPIISLLLLSVAKEMKGLNMAGNSSARQTSRNLCAAINRPRAGFFVLANKITPMEAAYVSS
jgi:hypothetical protein